MRLLDHQMVKEVLKAPSFSRHFLFSNLAQIFVGPLFKLN